MDLASEMPVPNFQPYIRDTLGGGGIALGLIGFANFIGMASVAFPGGYLADKYGRRRLITTMTFGMALSFLLFAFAPTWHFVLLGAIINSLCLIYQPALIAMFQDSLPPERRGMGSSIVQLINSTLNTPGPLIAGLLLWQFGLEWSMRIIYLMMTALYLAAAVWRLRLKETVINKEPMRFRYFVSSYPKAIKESFSVWKVVPRAMFWLLFSQILTMLGYSLFNVINALYAQDVLGIPLSQWWVAYVPLLLTMIVASIPIGKAVDTVGRKIPLILGILSLGLGVVIFVNGSFLAVNIAMILLGLGSLLWGAAAMAFVADLVAPENRGKINGFVNFVSYIAIAFGMLLGNYLYVGVSSQLPFYAGLVLFLVAAVIVILFVKEPANRAN